MTGVVSKEGTIGGTGTNTMIMVLRIRIPSMATGSERIKGRGRGKSTGRMLGLDTVVEGEMLMTGSGRKETMEREGGTDEEIPMRMTGLSTPRGRLHLHAITVRLI